MIFTVRVYVKNIEKYKGIYAISKIYLGLLRLPTLSLTLSLSARQAKKLKTRKRSPGPSKKVRDTVKYEKFIRKFYQKIFRILPYTKNLSENFSDFE